MNHQRRRRVTIVRDPDSLLGKSVEIARLKEGEDAGAFALYLGTLLLATCALAEPLEKFAFMRQAETVVTLADPGWSFHDE